MADRPHILKRASCTGVERGSRARARLILGHPENQRGPRKGMILRGPLNKSPLDCLSLPIDVAGNLYNHREQRSENTSYYWLGIWDDPPNQSLHDPLVGGTESLPNALLRTSKKRVADSGALASLFLEGVPLDSTTNL